MILSENDLTYYKTYMNDNFFYHKGDIADKKVKYYITGLDGIFLRVEWESTKYKVKHKISTRDYTLKDGIRNIKNGNWFLDQQKIRENKLKEILNNGKQDK